MGTFLCENGFKMEDLSWLSLPGALQGNSGRLRGVSHLMMCTAASALICRPQTAWKLHSVLSFISYQYDICPEQEASVGTSERELLFIYPAHARRRHEATTRGNKQHSEGCNNFLLSSDMQRALPLHFKLKSQTGDVGILEKPADAG